MFVLWYCYKRGREERLLKEQPETAVDGSDRIEELTDDPTLPAPHPERTRLAEPTGTTSLAAILPHNDSDLRSSSGRK